MKILFFDTETTGLPKNWNAPVSDLNNWPRLVQLAWQVYDENECLIEEYDFIVKPKGFSIPLEASNVHKITTEKANEVGEDLGRVLQLFYESVTESNLLIAHNYSYDYSIMGSELLRNGYENILEKKENICTMKSSTDFCKIPGPYGYKWPKLEELYGILFNQSFNAHNALDDIRATARCFWELKSNKIIDLKKVSNNKQIPNTNNYLHHNIEIKNLQYLPKSLLTNTIIKKIFYYQNIIIDSISKSEIFLRINRAGKAEHLIYLYYYVIHSLFWDKRESLNLKHVTKDKDGNILLENESVVHYDFDVIIELYKFLIDHVINESSIIGLNYSKANVIKLIEGRFSLYKFLDEQHAEGEVIYSIKSELAQLVYDNPLKSKMLIQNDGCVKIEDRRNSNIWQFVKKQMAFTIGLENIIDLLTSLGGLEYTNSFKQGISIIKVEDLSLYKALRIVLKLKSDYLKSHSYVSIIRDLIKKGNNQHVRMVISKIPYRNFEYMMLGFYCKNLILNGEKEKALEIYKEETLLCSREKRFHLDFSISSAFSEIGLYYEAIEITSKYLDETWPEDDESYHEYLIARNTCFKSIYINMFQNGIRDKSIQLALNYKSFIDINSPILSICNILLHQNDFNLVKKIASSIQDKRIQKEAYESLILHLLKMYNRNEAFNTLNTFILDHEDKQVILSSMIPILISQGQITFAKEIALNINDRFEIYKGTAIIELCKYFTHTGMLNVAIELLNELKKEDNIQSAYSEISIELMRIGQKDEAIKLSNLIDVDYDEYGNGDLIISDTYLEFSKIFFDRNDLVNSIKYIRQISDNYRRGQSCEYIIEKYINRNNINEGVEFAEFADNNLKVKMNYNFSTYAQAEIAKRTITQVYI